MKENEIEQEISNEGAGGNGVRFERDKPFDPFNVNGGHNHHAEHGHSHQDGHQEHGHGHQEHGHHHRPQPSPVSFTSSSPLTQHNSLSIGPRPTSQPLTRPLSQGADPIFDQNFNSPTNKPGSNLSQLKLTQQKVTGKLTIEIHILDALVRLNCTLM